MEGQYYKNGRHMSFPQTNLPLRQDEDFRNKKYSAHHQTSPSTGDFIVSPLENLPIDMVKDIPIADSLHLFDLGIMKRCLNGWVRGSYNFRLKFFGTQINEISKWLVSTNATVPTEINRTIRGLDTLAFWKGTELRTFLLYLGPVILKDYLDFNSYQHFLLLSSAVTICSSEYYLTRQKLLPLAEQLFQDYIEMFIEIYGIDSVSSNVHNLCHVCEDIKRFGCLPRISSYKFENTLFTIKNLLRNGNRPLAQVAKRLGELSKLNGQRGTLSYPILKHETSDPKEMPPFCAKVFKQISLMDGVVLSANAKDGWFLTKQCEIVQMKSAYYFESQAFVYGCSLKKITDFFLCPFESKRLNIYKSSKTFNRPMPYKTNNILCKMFNVEYKNNLIFFPLIHTLDLLCNV